MKIIQGITSDAKQKRSIVLDDGTKFSFTMHYSDLQQGWFITELTYNNGDNIDFTLYGLRITNSVDMLYQWKNKLPFGLACKTEGNREPMLQQDFATGSSNLYVLSSSEVSSYSEWLSA